MRLPNAEQATVDEAKLRDYLLSASHPVGRFKAAYFSRLGFRAENWTELRDRLLALAREGEAELVGSTEYGDKYLIHGTLTSQRGDSSEVSTIWIVSREDDKPRLVTVYPR